MYYHIHVTRGCGKYLGRWQAKLCGEAEAKEEGLRVGVGEAGDADADGLLPLDYSGEVGEVVEVLPPHHPDPNYPVPHFRHGCPSSLSRHLRRNLDGISSEEWACD